MKRLTKRSGISYIPRHQDKDYDAVLNDVELEQAYSQGINKLGLLEDLEEELGCPLDVIFKAIKNGVWYQYPQNTLFETKIIFTRDVNIAYDIFNNNFQIFSNNDFDSLCHKTKDYKKTWWLKEDKTE